LTKPRKPPSLRVRRKTIAATTSSEVATVRILRNALLRAASAVVSVIGLAVVMRVILPSLLILSGRLSRAKIL
jgi:hypothetical protein